MSLVQKIQDDDVLWDKYQSKIKEIQVKKQVHLNKNSIFKNSLKKSVAD